MAKKILQDMVIKKGSIPERKIEKKIEREETITPRIINSRVANNDFFKTRETKIEKPTKQKTKIPKGRMYVIALIAVIFLLFALSFLFSGAQITLAPKSQDISLNSTFFASKNASSSDLSFDLVVISGEDSKVIQGGDKKDVSLPAEGSVVIYNTFSSASQTLDVDTRLEGSNGKIYKTKKKVIVPGMTSAGKPGSIEVGIYASVPGEEYNSAPLDFKIFGFKGTPKYTKFYARSKGEISGGFKGKTSVVTSLDKTNAVTQLKTSLEAKLLKRVSDQIPSGFVLFKDAIFLDINDSNVTSVQKEDGVSVSIKGTLYGFLFNENKLTKKIAENAITNYDNSEVSIPKIKDLVFSLDDKESISFAEVKDIKFNLSGNAKVIWKVDEAKLKNSMLSKKKKDFNQVLAEYPNIQSAELTIRPFWKKTFPEESEDIKVIINYPN